MHRIAARIDRIDDDEIGAALDSVGCSRKKPVSILRTPGDPEHVFLPQLRRQLIEFATAGTRFRCVAALERGAALREEGVSALARGRHLRFGADRLVRRRELTRQSLRELDACGLGRLLRGTHDRVLIEAESDRERRQRRRPPICRRSRA